MRRLALSLLGLVAVIVCATSCAQDQTEPKETGPLRFFREHITVRVTEERTEVTGIYYFRNESDEPFEGGIKYPFPVDRHHAYPLRIVAEEFENGEYVSMGYSKVSSGIRWNMKLAPRAEKQVRVGYEQSIDKNHAVYIVATTREWERPIEVAEFEFHVPTHFEGVELSFEPDREEVRGDTTVYHMKEIDFLPDSDLVVTWQ